MSDINVFNKALKAGWIKKYLGTENHGKWKLLFDLELRNLAVKKFFEATSVKKIYQNISKYQLPLLQKYSTSGRTLNMRLIFPPSNS